MRQTVFAVLLAILLTAGGFFYSGWYSWNYKRPPQTVVYQQQISGANATVTQNPQQMDKQKLNSIGIGINPSDVKSKFIIYTRSF